MSSVAVIGGGITGLVTAYRLRQADLPVTVYEAGERCGGVIETVKRDGFMVESGPNTLLETSPEITQLIRELGLEARRHYTNPEMKNRFIVRGGKPVALPLSPPQFVTTKAFSLGVKLRLLREPFIGASRADIEENLAQFVVRRLGQEFLDYAINPFVAGVYAGDPKRLSVRHAFPKLYALEQKYGSLIKGQILAARERRRRGTVSKQNAKMLSFDTGLQALIDALCRGIDDANIKTRTRVRQLSQCSEGWRVQWEGANNGEHAIHTRVVLASPAHRLAEIEISSQAQEDLAVLNEIKYPPVTSISMGFKREDVTHPLNGFGMLIPEREGRKILGTIFTSSLFSNRAPSGHVTLASYIGGTRAPELALMAPEEIYSAVLEDLRPLLGVTGEPVFKHCRTYPKAIPQYEVGYGRFKEHMDQIEKHLPGLYLAGHFRDGISLSDSIVSGISVARRIREQNIQHTETGQRTTAATN